MTGRSHIWIIRSPTTFRRHPGDVAVRILDIACFAMHAVLRVDDEARARRLFHPFIDPRRAVAGRGAGIDVVLGALLQVEIGDPEEDQPVHLDRKSVV